MGPPTISLNKLALLDRLIETRSVTEAAKALRRSQPSVTAALNDLRAHFDDPLLVREGVGLRPTPFALLLAPDLAAFRRHGERLSERRKTFIPETATQNFVIRATDYLQSIFAPTMIRLIAPYPGLSLRFVMTEPSRADALSKGRVDFAFRLGGPLEAGVRDQPLLEDRYVVVWDRKTGRLEPGLDAFCARPHVLATPEGGDFGVIDEKLRALGRKRRISVRTQNIFSAVRLVANSPMIAVAPESVAREIAQAHDLAMGPPPIELPNAFISLTWSAANDSDLGSAWFREGFIRAFAETKSQRALG